MRTLLTVFAKEFLENLRDRRTLLSALLFLPCLCALHFAHGCIPDLLGFIVSLYESLPRNMSVGR